MSVRMTDRRRSCRLPSAYPATVRDRRGNVLARGRSANTSESGVLIICRDWGSASEGQCLTVEMVVPAGFDSRRRRESSRTVCYLCRVVRVQLLGQLLGLGVRFLEKLA